jgi:hypothetical protein
MSTLLEQASLVLIPSGYKEDTVYSVIPSNGSGDLSFTRASDGTRINSDGLVENTPWNLLTYSEDISNAAWLKTNMTVIANNATAPNGTLTADKITATAANATVANFLVQSTVIYTLSVYVKSGTGSNVAGKIGGQSSSGTFTSFTATNEWTLITCSVLSLGGNRGSQIQIINSGDSLFVWGAQLVEGSTAKPYFPTTDRLNVPRLTYQNGGGGCPSLLLEPQRTNLLTYSNTFSNAAWVKLNCSIATNSIISPDGTQNSFTLTSTVTNSNYLYNAITTANGLYTLSCFVKYLDTNTINISMTDFATGDATAQFNFSTGLFGTPIVTGSWTNTSTSVQIHSNGWYKISITSQKNAGLSVSSRIDSFVLGKSVYIYGAQLELASYASSYIPTTSASATRIADACSKTGISSLIGQTEGSVFVDVNLDARVTQTYFAISSSATAVTNYIGISFRSGTIVFEVVVGGLLQASATLTNSSTGRFKLAIGYKLNDFAFYANGSQIGVDNIGTVPACNDIVLFNNTFSQIQSMNYNQTVLFKTRLTNSELLTLSTI